MSKELQNSLQKEGCATVGDYNIIATKYVYEVWRNNDMVKKFGKYATGFYSLCDYIGLQYA